MIDSSKTQKALYGWNFMKKNTVRRSEISSRYIFLNKQGSTENCKRRQQWSELWGDRRRGGRGVIRLVKVGGGRIAYYQQYFSRLGTRLPACLPLPCKTAGDSVRSECGVGDHFVAFATVEAWLWPDTKQKTLSGEPKEIRTLTNPHI